MKTLALDDGDLVLSGGDYATVGGTAKIVQDLSFALRERVGSDPYHPYWGSVLPYFVGQPLTEDVKSRIVTGTQRTLGNYMAVQQAQVTAASVNDVGSKLRSSEVVQSVSSITAVAVDDSLQLTIALSTLAGDTVVLTPTVVG